MVKPLGGPTKVGGEIARDLNPVTKCMTKFVQTKFLGGRNKTKFDKPKPKRRQK